MSRTGEKCAPRPCRKNSRDFREATFRLESENFDLKSKAIDPDIDPNPGIDFIKKKALQFNESVTVK